MAFTNLKVKSTFVYFRRSCLGLIILVLLLVLTLEFGLEFGLVYITHL